MQARRQRFERYREQSFKNRFISHESLKHWIKAADERHQDLSVEVIGCSAEKREIYRLSLGTGKIAVLLWSQMHGDESTATLALFDVLNFLLGDDEQNEFRSLLMQHCTFHVIPMLNPDGAERWQRRNAQGIDVNRDFIALQSPEARLLKAQQELLQPAYAFNLHDQDSLWSVTGTRKPALISLLAPPAEASLEPTASMRKAVRIIAGLYNFLEVEIPGNTGRWKDEYEPRAVGETFQQCGVATILIESGGYSDETSKQHVRRLNFDLLLYAFQQIATGEMPDESAALATYRSIPLNTKEIFHIIIRNCRLSTAAGRVSMDIALNHEPVDAREERTYLIADMGDLSPFSAYLETYAGGAEVCAERIELNSPASFVIEGDAGKIIKIENGILKEYKFE